MDTNPTHNSFTVIFLVALLLSNFIHTLVFIWPPLIRRMKEVSKAVIHLSSLHNISFFVLMMPMRMDDALKFTFLRLQSISRPLSTSVSSIMGKVKTSQKSITGQNLPSDRYEPPNFTN